MIELTNGGQLTYIESFFTEAVSDLLLQVLLKKTPWKQEKTFYGNTFPRMTAYYADDGVKYSYSGATHESLPWPDYLLEVKKRVQKESGFEFNSLLLNHYRDGRDSIGWHSDNEKELGVNPVIASISLGAERNFQIRCKEEKQEYILKHGSLLIMGGTMQHHWQHCVPKTTKPKSSRVNLTFRNIIQ
jgi:alkylated DNA repair dioxygenase AlkB